MKFLDPKQWSKKTSIYGIQIPKGVFYFLGGVVVVTIVLWVVGFAYRSGMYGPAYTFLGSRTDSPFMDFAVKGGTAHGGGGVGGTTSWGGWGGGEAVAPTAPMMGGGGDMMYSPEEISIAPYPMPNYVSGRNAESFEVKEYSAQIKVGDSENICNQIAALKSNPDIVFENANVNEYGCNFRFKVVKASAESVLSLLQSFKPDQLDANTQTIKASIDEINNQEIILKKKLESIDQTLKVAEEAYDDIADTAAKEHDSKSLATIIQNKLALIERMTNERIMVNQALDQLSIQKSNEMDRLDYSFFSVNVYEDKILDWKQIKNEWQERARQFVYELNLLATGLTLGLIISAFNGLAVALYLFLFLIFVKYTWKYIKRFMQS